MADTPRSFTTTLAPRLAKKRAYALPRPIYYVSILCFAYFKQQLLPPPAPVTIATLPSKRISLVIFCLIKLIEEEKRKKDLYYIKKKRASCSFFFLFLINIEYL